MDIRDGAHDMVGRRGHVVSSGVELVEAGMVHVGRVVGHGLQRAVPVRVVHAPGWRLHVWMDTVIILQQTKRITETDNSQHTFYK